jgi:hypothetical protein
MSQPRADRPVTQKEYGIPETKKGMLAWSWAVEHLKQAPVYWVSTTQPDGRPHAMPTWGAWLDDAFWFEGGPETKRMKNLALNPAAVVHVERGDDVVIVEGEAERVFDLSDQLSSRLKAGFAKYIATHGYDADPANWANGGIWRLRPRKVLAWSAFPKDATRWRFDSADGDSGVGQKPRS